MKLLFKLVMSGLIYGVGAIVSLWLVIMLLFLARFQLDYDVMEKSIECSGREAFAKADMTGRTKIPEWCLQKSNEEKALELITKPGFYFGISALIGLFISAPVVYVGLWKKHKTPNTKVKKYRRLSK